MPQIPESSGTVSLNELAYHGRAGRDLSRKTAVGVVDMIILGYGMAWLSGVRLSWVSQP